jgi:hypothetical protein
MQRLYARFLRQFCKRSFSVQLTVEEEAKLKALEKGIVPATGEPLAKLRQEVFHEAKYVTANVGRSGAPVLKAGYRGPLLLSWYPEPLEKNPYCQIKLSEKQERWKRKLQIWRAQGRGPPKKGSGKRSGKKPGK